MKPIICQQCKAEMQKGEKLKTHWRDQHPEEYVRRQKWLGESEGKLRAAMILANEGMKKPGDAEYTPTGREET